MRDKIQNDHRSEALVTKLCKEKPTLFREEGKLLYYKDRVYIPPNKKLREQLLNNNDDAPIDGHPRVFKTYELLNCHYWWPSQLKDVKMYVKGCSACQQNKALRQKKAAPLNPHTPPELPWESISLDVIGPLPESNGFNAILSVIDRFSKMIHIIPMTTELSTKGLIDIYLKQIWKLHGIPKKITSDRGPQFTSELMKELCIRLGIQQNLSTAYHPQTDG